MNAKNQEYADLWARLETNQAKRRKSADCEKAITIISAQRERDFADRISDPDALIRMYGDRDTRISPSPAIKLYDADHPVMPEPPEPAERREQRLQDIAQSMMTAVLCAIGTLAAVVVLLLY